jgi:hypothetical protein
VPEPAAAQDLPDHDALEIRLIQPYQARKGYVCPGCNQDIAVGLGHLVVVPRDAPDLRRHWHGACWEHRKTRRPGRA